MSKFFGSLLFIVFAIISCDVKTPDSQDKSANESKIEIARINDVLKRYEEPSQSFRVSKDRSTQVKGKRGTIIKINPGDLETISGDSTGNDIVIELKELTNQDQLASTNIQTTSNGRLLVSGGAYYINLTSGGKQLKLKEGRTLSVEFPKLSNNEMSLFYGDRDSLGRINWQQAEQKFETRPKQKITSATTTDDTSATGGLEAILKYLDSESKRPLTPEEKKELEARRKDYAVAEKLYKAIELNKFGWINCDRFYEASEQTDLLYTFNDQDSVTSANIYLVFKDINSVIQDYYFSSREKKYDSGFKNIPIGAKTKLIAFSIKDGKAFAYSADLTIKLQETVQITLAEINEAQFGKLLSN